MKHAKEEDHINRLPDETLIMIFEKISEAKSLFNCTLVSKRFASRIPYTRFVSVQLPHCPHNLSGSAVEQEQFLSFRHFIKQFRCINTLHLQLPYSKHENPFVSWEIEFKNSLISTQFLILSAEGFNTMKKEEEEEDSEMDSFQYSAEYFHLIRSAQWVPWRHSFYYNDVRIQKLVITDSDGRGKIVARKDGVEESKMYQWKWQFWYLPVLQLPKSRGVMKGVKLAVCSDGLDGNGDGGLIGSADGEKTVLWEAAKEIMKQNPICSSQQKFDVEQIKSALLGLAGYDAHGAI